MADHDAPLRAQWKPALVRRKTREVNAVARAYGTRRTHRLSYPAAGLDAVPLECLVSAVRSVLFRSRLDTVYMVHHGDVHPDHRVTYQAAAAATKAFRMKGLDVSRVLSFETISSTEAAPPDRDTAFLPTVFHDISPCLEGKLRVMRLNASEAQEDPSPRGLSAIKALARWRGAAVAVEFAETFYLGRSLE